MYLLYDHDLGGVVSELQSPYKYTLKAKCGKENIYIRSRLVMYTGLGMQQNEELAQKSEEVSETLNAILDIDDTIT